MCSVYVHTVSPGDVAPAVEACVAVDNLDLFNLFLKGWVKDSGKRKLFVESHFHAVNFWRFWVGGSWMNHVSSLSSEVDSFSRIGDFTSDFCSLIWHNKPYLLLPSNLYLFLQDFVKGRQFSGKLYHYDRITSVIFNRNIKELIWDGDRSYQHKTGVIFNVERQKNKHIMVMESMTESKSYIATGSVVEE